MANAPGADEFMVVNASVEGTATATRDEMAALRAYKDAVVLAMKEEAPINKDPYATSRGRLRASIEGSVTGGKGEDAVVSFTALDYVKYVVGGTRPHRIDPKTKRALAFKWRTGTTGLHGFHGRGMRGGFLRSTPFGSLAREGKNSPMRLVTPSRAAARHALSRGLPRFQGRVLEPAKFNQVGRQIRGPVLGNIHPVNVRANMFRTNAEGEKNEHFGNIVLNFVHHPGSKPNDFIDRAIARASEAENIWADTLGEDWADDLVAAFKGEIQA